MMWLIYLIGTIDQIGAVICGIGWLFIILGILRGVILAITAPWVQTLDNDLKIRAAADEEISKVIKRIKRTVIIFPCVATLFFIAGNLLPSSNTLAAMYLIPKIAENQQLQQVSDKGIKLLNLKLDDWIKEAGDKS